MSKIIVVFSALLAVALGNAIKPNIDPTISWKIVGGADATEGQFPYQISLRDTIDDHVCGGSIINENWILTAAHCVIFNDASSYTVVTGSTTLNSGGDRYTISSIILHSGFEIFPVVENDIALVKLSSTIAFNDNVKPIEMETAEIGEVDCVVSGWGTTSDKGTPNNLQFLALRTITNTACSSSWINNTILDHNICTFTKTGEGVCYGDSGGPLVANGKQIGIVSWGSLCAKGRPDVYTRVSSYDSWITSQIA